MKKVFNFKVDLKNTMSNLDHELVAEDTGNVFIIDVLDESIPVDLTHCDVVIAFSKPGARAPVYQDMESGVSLLDAANGRIRVDLLTGSFSGAEGRVKAELCIKKQELATTARFSFNVHKPIINDETVRATTQFPILEKLLAEVEAHRDAAMAAGELGGYAKEQGDYAKATGDSLNELLETGELSTSVTLGAVETLEPTEQAYVQNVGDTRHAVLEFGIPKGVPGAGNVSSVNGIVSDSGGNVPLKAAHIPLAGEFTGKAKGVSNVQGLASAFDELYLEALSLDVVLPKQDWAQVNANDYPDHEGELMQLFPKVADERICAQMDGVFKPGYAQAKSGVEPPCDCKAMQGHTVFFINTAPQADIFGKLVLVKGRQA